MRETQVLLRREPGYGGFVFHPEDATFVHLDHEAFATAKRVWCDGGSPESEDARTMMRQLTEALPPMGGPVRYVDHGPGTATIVSNQFAAPTLIDFQITDYCELACPQCYASSVAGGRHVDWDDACLAFARMREAGVCQVAIGGGEPLRHPLLAEILAEVRANGMVPNLTTTGIGMSDAQLDAITTHCGAVALSLEGVGERFSIRRRQGWDTFREQVARFMGAGLNLVLQITLSAENCDELHEIAEYAAGIDGLYGVIFLAHKPAGRATLFDSPLAARPFAEVYPQVIAAVRRLRKNTRVGFDCCLSPLITSVESDLGFAPTEIVEGCSAVRGSIGLTIDLDCVPCTFLPARKLGNLREASVVDIWRNLHADAFRDLQAAFLDRGPGCAGCRVNGSCLGGCPVWDLVGCAHTEGAAP
ncbi:MAG: radical SAM protein [Rhodocyclaceae bacterium]|nr:radical SAM protein [Rhodocyclaceae bacterium]